MYLNSECQNINQDVLESLKLIEKAPQKQEKYAMDISPTEISRITDIVLPGVQEWRTECQ
jgi:hypothetical protein